MIQYIKNTVNIEKRTYIKGRFTGKYWSDLLNPGEAIYNIEVYEPLLSILEVRKIDKGDFENKSKVSFLSKIRGPVLANFSGSSELFELDLKDLRIEGPKLELVTQDGDTSYGTLTGIVYGYLVEQIPVEYEEPYYSQQEDLKYSTQAGHLGTSTDLPVAVRDDIKSEFQAKTTYSKNTDGWNVWDTWRTGGIRNFWSVLLGLILVLLFLKSFPFLLILLIPVLLIWLFRWWSGQFQIIRWVGNFILMIFLLGMASAFFSSIISKTSSKQKNTTDGTTPGETTVVSPNVSDQNGEIPNNSPDQIVDGRALIIHHRIWQDYEGVRYEADLKIDKKQYFAAIRDHGKLNLPARNESEMANVYRTMMAQTENRLNLLYTTFDSIQASRKLTRIQFANMIVSCIQDIPYKLVLPGSCDPDEQQDPAAKKFLKDTPDDCFGGVSYGVQSPAEFLGNLQGDCDTRVLLAFEVLRHYQYKVALLGSTVYQHAVLGVQLPGLGLAKQNGDKRYLLWETTASGFRAGILAPEVSDLTNWNIYLTN